MDANDDDDESLELEQKKLEALLKRTEAAKTRKLPFLLNPQRTKKQYTPHEVPSRMKTTFACIEEAEKEKQRQEKATFESWRRGQLVNMKSQNVLLLDLPDPDEEPGSLIMSPTSSVLRGSSAAITPRQIHNKKKREGGDRAQEVLPSLQRDVVEPLTPDKQVLKRDQYFAATEPPPRHKVLFPQKLSPLREIGSISTGPSHTATKSSQRKKCAYFYTATKEEEHNRDVLDAITASAEKLRRSSVTIQDADMMATRGSINCSEHAASMSSTLSPSPAQRTSLPRLRRSTTLALESYPSHVSTHCKLALVPKMKKVDGFNVMKGSAATTRQDAADGQQASLGDYANNNQQEEQLAPTRSLRRLKSSLEIEIEALDQQRGAEEYLQLVVSWQLLCTRLFLGCRTVQHGAQQKRAIHSERAQVRSHRAKLALRPELLLLDSSGSGPAKTVSSPPQGVYLYNNGETATKYPEATLPPYVGASTSRLAATMESTTQLVRKEIVERLTTQQHTSPLLVATEKHLSRQYIARSKAVAEASAHVTAASTQAMQMVAGSSSSHSLLNRDALGSSFQQLLSSRLN